MRAEPNRICSARAEAPKAKVITPFAGRLRDLLNQRARLPKQSPQLPAFFNSFARVPPIFQCVFVATWSARPGRTAMHIQYVGVVDWQTSDRIDPLECLAF
jgi:hypothetical protein